MMSLRARVKNGRLVLDEATDLPEGSEVRLLLVDDEEDWQPSDAQVAALQKSVAQAERGEVVPAEVVLRELRAR